IVVDTPPAQHALDFLEAPQRLLEFLDSRLVQILIHPAFAAGRVGFRLFQSGARRALHLMERVSGIGFLEDLSEFLLAFEGMSAGFRQRAARAALAVPRGYAALVLRDAKATEGMRVAMREQGRFFHAIPELPEDVHDLAGLARIADALFAPERKP